MKLRKAVFNIKQLNGSTPTGAALDFMLPLMRKGRKQRKNEAPCHLIVLTDGMSGDAVLEPAERLRAENITIHAALVSGRLIEHSGNKLLEEERVSFGQNFDSLKSIKNEIVHSICTEKGKQNKKAFLSVLS